LTISINHQQDEVILVTHTNKPTAMLLDRVIDEPMKVIVFISTQNLEGMTGLGVIDLEKLSTIEFDTNC